MTDSWSITADDVLDLKARLGAAMDAWVAALPPVVEPAPDPPEPDPAALEPQNPMAEPGDGTITLSWDAPNGSAPTGYRYGRDYYDINNEPAWSGLLPATARNAKLDKLINGHPYLVTLAAVYPSEDVALTVTVTPEGPAPAPVPPVTPPATAGLVTWPSGAFTIGSAAGLALMGEWRGRPMGVCSTFTSRDSTSALESMWWLDGAPSGMPIAVGMPMALAGGLDQDLSASFTKIAAAMKADGRLFWIRLGWEMNLPSWAWHVSDANLPQWRSRWSQYYRIFKTALGAKGLVGFNPNIGGNQSGLSGSILRAWVDGEVDWCGPDAYDCWPPFNSDLNVREQLTRDQGLNWWAVAAAGKGVPLCLPEWGVASGTQWAGHQGGDNPRYMVEISKWLVAASKTGRGVGFDAYFNEPAAYVASAIYPPAGVNGKAAAQYKALWGS